MKNTEALKLPDPLLVRYFRNQKLDLISLVKREPKTNDYTVTLSDGTVERWKHVSDWMPVID